MGGDEGEGGESKHHLLPRKRRSLCQGHGGGGGVMEGAGKRKDPRWSGVLSGVEEESGRKEAWKEIIRRKGERDELEEESEGNEE